MKRWLLLTAMMVCLLAHGGTALSEGGAEDEEAAFTVAVTADVRHFSGPGRYDTPSFFRGAVEAMAVEGGGAFMISPGDMDPLADALWTITTTLGSDYGWYPAVGNHELPGAGKEAYRGENMDWLRDYDYGDVNSGPSGCPTTTYSFDHGPAHFVILNEYCDSSGDTATWGDVPDHLYDWLAEDLANTDARWVFVVGHEPAYPQPDADSGRVRHVGDSLDAHPAHRDRFWALLQDHDVVAYLCGHTHNYSAVQIDGVWQLDVGHARGRGDTGAASTFVLLDVSEAGVAYRTYRDDRNGGAYTLAHRGVLAGQRLHVPLVWGTAVDPTALWAR